MEEIMGIIGDYKTRSCRVPINRSWDRCIGYGLFTESRPKAPKVSDDSLEQSIENCMDILDIAEPYIIKMALALADYSPFIGLANHEGLLLQTKGNAPGLMKLGYERGHIHLEKYMGTNAIGTCIETGKPIVVWGDEHFFVSLRCWASLAYPIYTHGNTLKAVVYALFPIKKAQKGLMAAIAIMGHSIERQLQLMGKIGGLLGVQQKILEARDDILEASSIIFHEVGNSLTNISASIQLLQLDKTNRNFSGGKILKEIERVAQLLGDFKLLSKRREERDQRYSLDDTLQLVIDLIMPRARLGNVDIIYDPHIEPVYMKVGRDSLQHIFTNLMDNAIQAMEDGGILTIETRIDPVEGMAVIDFKDTGTGIPPEEIPHIFKIFHTTKKNGSGLGLYICQTIIKSYGGDIQIESIEGKGSTFSVGLPII